MKTTIDIPDALLKQVRRLAAERNTTVKAIVESALRDALAKARPMPGESPLQLHVFAGEGLQTGLSWDDWSSIRSLSYEGRGG
jgi:hypothetical protein